MAKAPTRAELERSRQLWAGTAREEALDGMFGAMREAAQEATGLDVCIAAAHPGEVGLPLPALSLRYLFQSTVFPLGKIVQITGEEGSCKSSFLYEVFRWHMVYGGGAAFMENEDKDSPELRNSILGWNARWLRRLEICETRALEDWMDALTMFAEISSAQQDAELGPGRTIPVAFGIDSIMSTAPREELDKIQKEGHSSRNYALAANLISAYMKSMPKRLGGYPFTIIGTNHLKPSTDYMGRPVSNVSGGKSVKFHETYEIEMHRAPGCDIDLLNYGGLRLKLVARKNSLGPSRKQIAAELLWWMEEFTDPDTGVVGFRQQTAWDWDTASIEMLLSFENAKGKRTIFNRLMEICDINVANRGARTAWSRALGIPEVEPQDFRVLGAALERHPELLEQMYPTLGITARRPFQPGVDYRVLLDVARTEANAEATNLYGSVDNMPRLDPETFDPEGRLAVPPDAAPPVETEGQDGTQ